MEQRNKEKQDLEARNNKDQNQSLQHEDLIDQISRAENERIKNDLNFERQINERTRNELRSKKKINERLKNHLNTKK